MWGRCNDAPRQLRQNEHREAAGICRTSSKLLPRTVNYFNYLTWHSRGDRYHRSEIRVEDRSRHNLTYTASR